MKATIQSFAIHRVMRWTRAACPERVFRAWFAVWIVAVATSSLKAVDFEKEIAPILETHCIACHGPEEQEASFRVDRLARLLRGGDSGEPAVVRGEPENSFLMKAVRHQESGYEMPPDGRLAVEEIERLAEWIRVGAPTPQHYGPEQEEVVLKHWAFIPLEKPPVNRLDDLIDQRLSAAGIQSSPRADRVTLIRRLYLTVLGIPPSPDDVRAFVNDRSDRAWENLVAKVLDSPLFGERFAALWLDLIRFGETHGYEMNRERPTAWAFRDWIIDCFNEDMPYNEFVKSQIAGDAFGRPIGTGFLVAGPVDQVKGQDPKLKQVQRMNELDDMINTVGTAFLGLTTGCARCHDHKFDPISHSDYYSLQAIFAGVNHGNGTLPLDETQANDVLALKKVESQLKDNLQQFVPRVRQGGLVRAIDDAQAKKLVEVKGLADKVEGAISDWSGDGYSWWNHEPDVPVIQYAPKLRGRFRIWLSWGAGFSSHTQRARYWLQSANGDQLIAEVNQQVRADQQPKQPVDQKGIPQNKAVASDVVKQSKQWSGFYDAGVFELDPQDSLVLTGGDDAQAVTADVVVFQELRPDSLPDDSNSLELRESVSSLLNVETFSVRQAEAVRFWIDSTNQGEPCIDEIEVFSGEMNVALASNGSRATSSGDFVHPKHRLSQINDGEFGNSKSWISSQVSGGWVQIEFKESYPVERIQWARDREGEFTDRTAIDYRIEIRNSRGNWEYVAGSSDRRGNQPGSTTESDYQFGGFAEADRERGLRWLESLRETQSKIKAIEAERVVYVGQFSQPGLTHRLYRGEPSSPREQVSPAGISAFADWQLDPASPERARRERLATWIADQNNPLTARVIVNRIWQFHFGTGIVSTPSDFGRNGAEPTHPELIDWLASELIESGWSLKHIHRLILHSHTWTQSDSPNEACLKVDADNRLLWRFSPRRMEAEAIRDSILSVTGVLNLEERGGPGFSAFEVQMENVRHYHPKENYGPEDWRRMIYMTKVRQEKDQVFGVFDCPDASMVVAKRSRSTTPLQALSLLNSSFMIQQASLFAERLSGEFDRAEDQVTRAWDLCFQRRPTDSEMNASLALVREFGLPALTRAVLNANEFVFIP